MSQMVRVRHVQRPVCVAWHWIGHAYAFMRVGTKNSRSQFCTLTTLRYLPSVSKQSNQPAMLLRVCTVLSHYSIWMYYDFESLRSTSVRDLEAPPRTSCRPLSGGKYGKLWPKKGQAPPRWRQLHHQLLMRRRWNWTLHLVWILWKSSHPTLLWQFNTRGLTHHFPSKKERKSWKILAEPKVPIENMLKIVAVVLWKKKKIRSRS